jgi:hypothetical protein
MHAVLVLVLVAFTTPSVSPAVPQAPETKTGASGSPVAAPSLPQPMAFEKAFPLAVDSADKFLNGGGAALWERMTPAMQQALGGDSAKWSAIAAGIPQQIGRVTETSGERMLPALQLQTYTRLIRTDSMPVQLVVSVALTPEGKIAGLFARPAGNPAETKFLDYKDKVAYRFPLSGEWTIYQGGRSVYDNYHAAFPDERFAYDIVAFREGSMYRDGATSLETFHGFGQAVVAAAGGTVVSAEDKYDDNPLNQPSSSAPKQGNNVVIDHGNGEFSLYAHLKRGTVRVKAGDAVTIGQPIGQLGNSGNSPIPHLHFHLQNSATWFQGEGLPVAFHRVVVNGKPQVVFEPLRGDVVKAE